MADAAGIILSVIGLVLDGILGIIQILPIISVVPQGAQSIVRIAAGLHEEEKLGGDIPGITVWNENGKRLGSVKQSGQIEAGSFADIAVPQTPPGQQPTYLRIEGGKKSICVAYIGHAWSDGTQLGWLGDMGSQCGKQFYYSDVIVHRSNGTQYKPQCTWIGGTGSSADWTTQMTIHTPHFSAMSADNGFSVPADTSTLCNQPATIWSNDPVVSSGANKRLGLFGFFSIASLLTAATDFKLPALTYSLRAPQIPFEGTIIGSHHSQHNSTALCSNRLSYGPDFVSFHEGIFCDMHNRRTLPLCDSTIQSDCYDWNSHTIIGRRLKKRKMRYYTVTEWT
ncbi:hypothetical protein BT63DRAFT_459400 [Microthyrium microscopicum]|uniref:Uncharacterized protein n=1 Tax=Microthyrium microscopicum TaxID=703497 RepID=A0A6A6U144_9PEZI|nr:hypothetical protein BT63DRAFT_459400 [Microthyrium microscopicum]